MNKNPFDMHKILKDVVTKTKILKYLRRKLKIRKERKKDF